DYSDLDDFDEDDLDDDAMDLIYGRRGYSPYYSYSTSDIEFLGTDVTAIRRDKRKKSPYSYSYYYDVKPKDRQDLRDAIHRAQGVVYIARRPRLDAYFGREVAPADLAGVDLSVASRVVVQPDFSVVVIGTNPAPAAELAPFCERTTGHAGHGAMIFKITRESVV